MSGFAGIIRIAPSAESDEADRDSIERMARAIAFRGPDSLQKTRQPGASFAFSLLKIGPAPQGFSQPCTVAGETWFLGDARCDGRDDLIFKLEQHGVSTPTPVTDEELVLHAFSRFGESAFPDLDGDFSFVLWKPLERRLLAFRDLTGSRPFFFSCQDGLLGFSNTMQAILALPAVSRREYDLQFIGDFLLGAPHHDPERTVYRDIRRLPGGHLLEFSSRGLSVRRVANMPVEDLILFKDDRDYAEEFVRLFSQALRDRLPSGETTIMLSGGLDSTTLAAGAVSLRRSGSPGGDLKLRSLSVDSRPVVDDPEADLASRVADFLGFPCQVVHSGDVLPFAGWEDSHEPFPEPVLDPYSKLYLSYYQLIAQNSRVVLSGNGADEVLRLQALPYLKFLQKQHGTLSVLSALGRYLVTQGRLPPLGAGIRSGVQRLFGKKIPAPSFPPWLAPDFERRWDLPGRWRLMNLHPPSPHPFNPKAYASLNDLSVSPLLEFFDATWTGCAVEPREPFLDRRLSRFLLRIPLIPWAMDKYLLRCSQTGILPPEIRLRPKSPVTQDVLLLHASSGKWTPGLLDSHPVLMQSLVDWPRLANFLQRSIDDSLYLHLRPVALARWLDIVDKSDSVRCST